MHVVNFLMILHDIYFDSEILRYSISWEITSTGTFNIFLLVLILGILNSNLKRLIWNMYT